MDADARLGTVDGGAEITIVLGRKYKDRKMFGGRDRARLVNVLIIYI